MMLSKNTSLILLILWVFIGLQSCKTHQAAFSGTPWIKHIGNNEVSFRQSELDKVTQYIKENTRTTGMIALYDGKVFYEYGDLAKISYIASCRKSVMSMLYGKHVDNGTIDLEENIGNLGIDEKDGLLDKEKEATVEHIITSRSGVHHVASNAGYDKESFQERGSVEPGEFFVYNNWDFNVAGHILEHYTERSVYEELEDQFAIPLGFQDWNIKNQKKSGNKRKSQYLAYHMFLSTRDMAKLGQLMLNEGSWDGQQLISKEWVKKTTSEVTPIETMIERFGPPDPNNVQLTYGYMWWLVNNFREDEIYDGAYVAIGYGGQFIAVVPKAKMVFAHKTKLDLLSLAGIAYHATSDSDFWEMVDMLIKSKKVGK